MIQRKLTEDEMGDVMIARCTLRKIRQPLNKPQCIDHALVFLDCVTLHATTDGKPYVEPEPPILDGYRLAVAGDEVRADCLFLHCSEWTSREPGGKFMGGYTFIVPTDRTPTDAEASQLPLVMVRDYPDRPWEKSRLVCVSEGGYTCLAASRRNFDKWAYCRHLYPGE